MECRACHEDKPEDSFYFNAKKNALDTTCKKCRIVQVRINTLARNYGVTHEEVDQQLKRQSGKCAICCRELHLSVEDYRDNARAVIDHDHDYSFLRGILCQNCNRDLGRAGDSREEFERRFGRYLDNPTWQITGQMELDLGL